jgi:FtsP/CotA-like multicopper oxidase with cupredoxin domain
MQLSRAISLLWMVVGCAKPGAEPGKRPGGGIPEPAESTIAPRDARPNGVDAASVALAGQPVGWSDGLSLRRPQDLNPDPRILEITLEAKVAPLTFYPGTTTPAWTYDGGIPGPLIRLKVGDRLIVHFTNKLPEPTTIHWHGLRIPVEMDGVPDHPIAPVAPGKSFKYDFVVKDAGLFWYHPHFRSAAQVGDGLYGPLLVEDPEEPEGLGDELVLVLSDLSVDTDGNLRPHNLGGDLGTLFGREGEVLLANGRVNPVLKARAGVRQRWRIVNAARSRYFQLAAEGQAFVRIGGDGGLIPAPYALARPVVIPGERLDLLWEPRGQPGSRIQVRWVPAERGYGSTFARPEEQIFQIELTNDPPVTAQPAPLQQIRRSIAPLELAGATAFEIALTRNDVDGKFFLGVNGQPFGGDEHIKARIGETQIWTIENALDWAHPFHLHGFFYQVLEENGVHRQPIEWKDTADVPAKGKLKIAVRFDERPGLWMYHCHILDHADAGMMGMVHVRP